MLCKPCITFLFVVVFFQTFVEDPKIAEFIKEHSTRNEGKEGMGNGKKYIKNVMERLNDIGLHQIHRYFS